MHVKTIRNVLLGVSVIIFILLNVSFCLLDETAREVVRKADENMRGQTSRAVITIQTVRASWTRELKLKTWSKGSNYTMILVTAPAKENGTVFLKRDKEVWNWIPSIERVIKLPPSMMNQSWMGTDFTNDDLVKESSVVNDYNHSFAGDSMIEGRSCYKIMLMPKPEAAVVWGKVLVWIDKKDYLQMRAEFYDEENELVNIMEASDIKQLGGRLLPSKLEMIPFGKKGQKTIMKYENIAFDEPLEDKFFSPENMKKMK